MGIESPSSARPSPNRAPSSRAVGRKGAATSPSVSPRHDNLYLGIDFGTSGARCVVIDEGEEILHSEKVDYGDAEEAAGSASVWRDALFSLLGGIPSEVRAEPLENQISLLQL